MYNTLGNTFPIIYPLHLKTLNGRRTLCSIKIAASNLFFYFDEETFRPEVAGYVHFLEILDKWLGNTMGPKIHPVMLTSDENPFELHFNPYLLFENRGDDQGLTTVINNGGFESLEEWLDDVEDDEHSSVTTALVAKDASVGSKRLLHLATVDYFHYPYEPEDDDVDIYDDGYFFDFDGVMALRRAILSCLYPTITIKDNLTMKVVVNDFLDSKPIPVTTLYKSTRVSNSTEFALFCNPFKSARSVNIGGIYNNPRCLINSTEPVGDRFDTFGRIVDNIPSRDYSESTNEDSQVFESDLGLYTYMTSRGSELYRIEGFNNPVGFEQMFQTYTEGFTTIKQPWEV